MTCLRLDKYLTAGLNGWGGEPAVLGMKTVRRCKQVLLYGNSRDIKRAHLVLEVSSERTQYK